MPTDAGRNIARTPRRRFLLAATAAAALAAPRVSRAQSVNWRFQSAWSPRDFFHEFALDYAGKVEAMTGGRLKLDVVAAGSVVPPFQISDAVHAGILDGGHGLAAFRYNRHKASALFSTPPSFGWDSQSFLAWFYYGGGEALYRELLTLLRLDLVGILYLPMPTQPLGWFRKEIRSVGDLKGLRFRTFGLAGEVLKALGAVPTMLPAGDVAAAMERGVLDASESASPTTDLLHGMPNVAKHWLMGSHHRQVEVFEIVFNRSKFEALPGELRAVLRQAAFAASSDQLWHVYQRYAEDFEKIRRRGVAVVRTGANILQAELGAWDRIIAEHSKEPFFAKVIAAQKAWVKQTGGFLQANNLDNDALTAAYRHFFG